MPQDQDHGANGNEPLKIGHGMLIALGGNLTSPAGTPAETLRAALVTMKKYGVVIRAVSSFYHTPAFPAESGADFVNAAARISSGLSAERTLEVLHRVEAAFGRNRVTRWGQRTLDLDLIADGELVLPDADTHAAWRSMPLREQVGQTPEQLILPHPRMQDRAFVLVPLCDIAPDWVHPLLGQSVAQMLSALPEADRQAVRRLD